MAVATAITTVRSGSKYSAVRKDVNEANSPIRGGPSTKPNHPQADTMATARPAFTPRMCPEALKVLGMTNPSPAPREQYPARTATGRSTARPAANPMMATTANVGRTDRTGNRVELTSAGSMLLRYVRQIDKLVGRAEQEIAALNRMEGGELSLGVSTTISQYVLPRMLKEFRKEHPKIRLAVRSGNTEHIVEALIDQKVSMGLIEGPARRREGAYKARIRTSSSE